MTDRRETQLAAFDMEGCLTRDPTVWEIMHRKNNTWQSHGEPYWLRFRAGELGYDEFARLDVSAWQGAPVEMLRSAAAGVRFMPGCRQLLAELKKRGVHLALISNGLMCVARRFACECGVQDIFANKAVVAGGKLTGEIQLDVPYNSKGEILQQIMARIGVSPNRVVAVGDGVADVAMFRAAATAIAICPEKAQVRHAATHVVEEQNLERCADIILDQ